MTAKLQDMHADQNWTHSTMQDIDRNNRLLYEEDCSVSDREYTHLTPDSYSNIEQNTWMRSGDGEITGNLGKLNK